MKFPILVHSMKSDQVLEFKSADSLTGMDAAAVERAEYDTIVDGNGRVLTIAAEGITSFRSGTLTVETTDRFVSEKELATMMSAISISFG